MKLLWGLIIVFFVSACASEKCRRREDLSQTKAAASKLADEVKGTVSKDDPRTFVYKYDGSKQCNFAEGVAAEEMAKELKAIKVHSMAKRPDGLMHVQVCGSNTGMANVFEISTKDLAKAQAAGFKVWSFDK